MTSANIRHHLSLLVADGLIEINEVRKKKEVARKNIFSCEVISEDGLDQLDCFHQ